MSSRNGRQQQLHSASVPPTAAPSINPHPTGFVVPHTQQATHHILFCDAPSPTPLPPLPAAQLASTAECAQRGRQHSHHSSLPSPAQRSLSAPPEHAMPSPFQAQSEQQNSGGDGGADAAAAALRHMHAQQLAFLEVQRCEHNAWCEAASFLGAGHAAAGLRQRQASTAACLLLPRARLCRRQQQRPCASDCPNEAARRAACSSSSSHDRALGSGGKHSGKARGCVGSGASACARGSLGGASRGGAARRCSGKRARRSGVPPASGAVGVGGRAGGRAAGGALAAPAGGWSVQAAAGASASAAGAAALRGRGGGARTRAGGSSGEGSTAAGAAPGRPTLLSRLPAPQTPPPVFLSSG